MSTVDNLAKTVWWHTFEDIKFEDFADFVDNLDNSYAQNCTIV